jgi:uncharacterized damage-inducible protein DinB
MRSKILVVRHLLSSVALSSALALVCFAQQAAGGAAQTAPQAQQPLKDYPSARIEGLVREWTRARDYTKEYLDVMPEEHLGFKPTPEIRSFAEQMLHLANGNFGLGSRVLGAANPYQAKNLEQAEEFKGSKAALVKVVMESYDFIINNLKNTSEAKLDERVPLFNFNRQRVGALALVFEHQTHHRGQTTIYIRLKGIKPPNERLA